MTVTCIRCNAAIEEYRFTRLKVLPYGERQAPVMLECRKCGHVEFLAASSPLLADLQAAPVYAGDGD
jgi:hypothetical protein